MDQRDAQDNTPPPHPGDLVSDHGAAKQAEASDPLDLVGTVVPGGDLDLLARCFIEEYASMGYGGAQILALARCFIEEYASMGYGGAQILALFRDPVYVAVHPVYQSKGEEAVRGLIHDVLAECGVFRVSESFSEEPPHNQSELVQIEVPAPSGKDRS